MSINKFYLNPNGDNILQASDLNEFGQRNPELKPFLEQYKLVLNRNSLNDFQTMVYWVIGQIISNQAAHRMINGFKTDYPNLSPGLTLNLGLKTLIEYIPYPSKCRTILNLATFFDEESNMKIDDLTSTEIIKYYSRIKGIGPWTVKMLLIYNYGRLDILAIEDLGVRQGIAVLYGLDGTPNIPTAKQLTDRWGDLATIGSLLSWRVIQ